LPRKTDSANPGDWIAIAEADLALVRLGAEGEVSFGSCRAKLAEVLEKVAPADRTGERVACEGQETNREKKLSVNGLV
jgi:hypothetical protein